MAAMNVSTPINTITRENLPVLIRNNTLDDTLEFTSDNDMMETDSPVRSKNLQPISKKLFHSPLENAESEVQSARNPSEDRSKKSRKRKQFLIPDSNERFKRAYIQCEGDGYNEGMRKKVLISLFHNKEYSMEVGF